MRRIPLVLLHGFGSGSFTWGPVLDGGLATGGRTAVAFDRTGFGSSVRPVVESAHRGVNPYSLAGAVDATTAVLDGLGEDAPAVLVGHSAGALVAVAATLAEAPGRIAGLVLISPAIIGAGPPAAVEAVFRLPLARRWGPPLLRAGRPFVNRAVASAWHDRSRLEASGLAASYGAATREPRWAEGLVELTLATDRRDAVGVAGRLAEITVPTLVVRGDRDRIVGVEAAASVAERVAEGRLVTIPDCGHVPHEERPSEVVAAVGPFLDELDRRSS